MSVDKSQFADVSLVFVGPMIITYLIPRIGFGLAINSASLAFIVAAVLVMMMKETRGIEITTLDR